MNEISIGDSRCSREWSDIRAQPGNLPVGFAGKLVTLRRGLRLKARGETDFWLAPSSPSVPAWMSRNGKAVVEDSEAGNLQHVGQELVVKVAD